MIWLLTLAARNLLRNTRRTLISAVAVFFGVVVQILGFGMVEGLDENALRAAGGTMVGEVLLRPEGYPKDALQFLIEDARPIPPDVAARLDAAGDWAPRLFFSARLVHGPDALRISGLGYDPARDPLVFPRDPWHLDGTWPSEGQPALVVGSRLAKLMALTTGAEVVLEARTAAGAINALPFQISGVLRVDHPLLDAGTVWMRQEVADQLVASEGRRSHVAVRRASVAAPALSGGGWVASSLHDEVADLLQINQVRRRAIGLMVFILMAIAGTGIANTIVMAAYERVREIGTLLALGMERRQIRDLFLLEGALLGLGAGVAGAVVGTALVLYWQAHGIDLSAKMSSMEGNVPVSSMLYTKFSLPAVGVSLLFSVGVAVLASLQPARRSARLNPADAVRAD